MPMMKTEIGELNWFGGRMERTFALTDYYIDSAGRQQELDGVWTVNGEAVSNREMKVNPSEPLVVY